MRENRSNNELRPCKISRGVISHAQGSCEIQLGGTRVLCVASVEEGVSSWRKGQGLGWVTAEYSLLPGSTHTRNKRERFGAKGRTLEIERLIGRSLRSVVDFSAMGEYTITVDCDVIQADGGTRTAAITGAYVALSDAFDRMKRAGQITRSPLTGQVAAVSVGLVDGHICLDLDYAEDSRAEVDMNVVMDGNRNYIEVQGTGERITFDRTRLDALLDAAEAGIIELQREQRLVLGQE